jgi:hypothetical protein
VFIVSMVFAAWPVLAETVELTPVADVAFLYSPTPPFRQNLLNGGAAPLGASVHSGAPDRGSCSILRFDISQIPAGAKIVRVELNLTPMYSYAAGVYTGKERLAVYQLAVENAAWTEGAGESLRDPENDPISAPGANGAYVDMESYTDESHHDGVRWLSGQNFGTMDFSGDELGSFPLSESGIAKTSAIGIELPPKLIEEWQQNPELAKAGLALWMTSADSVVAESRFAIFFSREQEMPPRLVVEYKRP